MFKGLLWVGAILMVLAVAITVAERFGIPLPNPSHYSPVEVIQTTTVPATRHP